MRFGVFYTPEIIEDIRAHVRNLRDLRVSDNVIERWFDRLFDLLNDLSEMPRRYAVDARASASLGYEVRKLNFGDHIVAYRVDEASRVVILVSFKHGARRA